MKTHAIMIMAVLISAFLWGRGWPSFAQEISKQDYLEKSGRQKTGGFILLGEGVALATSGVFLFSENFTFGGGAGAEGAMMIVGTLAALGSIPMFISSQNNAKKIHTIELLSFAYQYPKVCGQQA